MTPTVHVHADHESASAALAAILRAALAGTGAVLLPTGATPMRAYELLAAEPPSAVRARIVQLDEYVGVADDDRRSLFGWLRRAVLDTLAVAPESVIRLDGCVRDPAAACSRHDRAIAALGGLDLAVLGLGPNGHLGFNEPPSAVDAPSRVVALTPASRTSNASYWGSIEAVPERALTTGLAAILAARRIVVIATGEHKRAILRRALDGPETDDVPASHLRRTDAELLVDRAARPARDSPDRGM